MKTHTKLRTIARACLALIGLTLLAGIASAQTSAAGSIEGRVLNAATGQYLKNATVELVGTGQTTTSGDAGVFTFTNVPAGAAKVRVTYTGLDAAEQAVSVPASGVARPEFALQSAEYDSNVFKLDGFVVAASKEGNAKAIVEQRQAVNIKTVIASDAFGTVSEDNVGEFLKYMSGLSIDYVENDARQVRVRGMSAKYASVTIDGNPVASADNAIATGRSFQFEQVSLSTVDTIELNKTPLADQSADSLAGSINVKSKSALNQKGRRISYNANITANEYEMTLGRTIGWDNQRHYKALPGGSLEFSDTIMNGRLGIVAAVNHTGTYVEQKIIANLARTFDNNPDNNETETPFITQVNWQDGLKPTFRDAVLLNLDFKATPDMVLSLRTSYNAYDAPFHNRNWTLSAVTTAQTNLTASSVNTSSPLATNTGQNAVIAGTNFRKYGATFTFNPAMNWKINENLTLDAALSYSRSYQWYDSDAEGFINVVSVRMNGVSWGYTSDEGEPNLNLRQLTNATSNTASWFNVANYNDAGAASATIADRNAKDQFFTGRADLTIKLPKFPRPTVLKVGVDSRLLVKDIENWTKTYTMDVSATGINLNNHVDPYRVDPLKGERITDINGQIGAPPSLNKWSLYDIWSRGNTDPLRAFTSAAAAGQPFWVSEAQAAGNLRFKLANNQDFEETIRSAYIRADVKASEKIHVVAGLRFESTETEGRGIDDLGNARAVAASGTTNTNNLGYVLARFGTRVTNKNSYDDLFPSMQIRFAPTQNTILRGAYYRSILRPDVQNTARGLVVNDTAVPPTITDANPDLKPEYADNFEVRVERYFEPVGLISGGVFYKQIHDVQATIQTLLTPGNIPQNLLDSGYSAADLATYEYNRVVNGPDTSVWGFELDYNQQLSFLPGALKGFGVFANYTYTDLEEAFFHTGGSGVPKHAMNAGLTYRNKRFNGQIKFNWVGERVLAMPGYALNPYTGEVVVGSVVTSGATAGTVNRAVANSGRIDYEGKRLQIDINLDYRLHRRAVLFANIANLTAAPSVRYATREANLIRHGAFGAKYTVGVKGTF